MTHKWYLLSLTGSLTKSNTYVRKYTAQSHRGGVLIGNPKSEYRPKPSIATTVDDGFSIKRKPKIKQKLFNKKSQSSVEAATLLIGTAARIKNDNVIKDTPQMREFFAEVRKRDLMAYYQNLGTKERLLATHRLVTKCPCCGLDKCSQKNLSRNAYCKGPTKISLR